MRICKNEITDHLRKHFGANPLRSPESRIQPLCLLEINKKKSNYLGEFKFLVKGGFSHELPIKESIVANVSDKRSSQMDVSFGFKFLDGYLKALGVDPASVGASISSAKKMDFSFSNVRRKFFDPLQLGMILSSNEVLVDTDNFMLAEILKGDNFQLALITDVIVSNNFSFTTYKESGAEADIDIPIIEQALSSITADVKLEKISTNEVAFKAEEDLTFAFSALEITIDPESGKIGRGSWLKNLRSAKGNPRSIDDLSEDQYHLLDKILLDENEVLPLLIEF